MLQVGGSGKWKSYFFSGLPWTADQSNRCDYRCASKIIIRVASRWVLDSLPTHFFVVILIGIFIVNCRVVLLNPRWPNKILNANKNQNDLTLSEMEKRFRSIRLWFVIKIILRTLNFPCICKWTQITFIFTEFPIPFLINIELFPAGRSVQYV
jgi:hypothetical protein